MERKICLFAIFVLILGCEAKKVKPVVSHPYIFSLDLKFNEEKIVDYVVDSFFATYRQEESELLRCDITLSDIIKTIPFKKLTITDFDQALEKLNLSISDEDITNFISNLNYTELNAMGFTVEKMYKNIVKAYFKDRSADLLECLNILGVGAEFSTAYTFGTDEDMFNALRNGNYSRYNLEEIQTVINAPITLKDIINILGLKKFDQVALENFVNNRITPVLFEKGLTEENLKSFLQSLGLTVSNYKNSKTLKKCYSSLTKDTSLAVAISENEIVTNDDSVINKYLNLKQYTFLTAKSVQNDGVTYTIFTDNISNKSDNIICIKIDGTLPSYVQQTTTYEGIASKLCLYITIDNDVLLTQNVTASMVDEQLAIPKFYTTVFKKGSPLICEQSLYGLAAINRPNMITFDYFEEGQIQQMALPIYDKPQVMDAIKEFLENIMANFDQDCKNEDKELAETSNSANKIDSDEESGESVVDHDKAESGEESTESVEDHMVVVEENTESDLDDNNNIEQHTAEEVNNETGSQDEANEKVESAEVHEDYYESEGDEIQNANIIDQAGDVETHQEEQSTDSENVANEDINSGTEQNENLQDESQNSDTIAQAGEEDEVHQEEQSIESENVANEDINSGTERNENLQEGTGDESQNSDIIAQAGEDVEVHQEEQSTQSENVANEDINSGTERNENLQEGNGDESQNSNIISQAGKDVEVNQEEQTTVSENEENENINNGREVQQEQNGSANNNVDGDTDTDINEGTNTEEVIKEEETVNGVEEEINNLEEGEGDNFVGMGEETYNSIGTTEVVNVEDHTEAIQT